MLLLKLSPKSLFLSPLLLLLLLPGCAIFGVLAQALPNNIPAAYAGLKGKDSAVMVWTDRTIAVDWPALSIDIMNGVQKKLMEAQKADKPNELEGTTFPVTPQSMARFQLDHPNADTMSITEIAPIVGVRRLIYVEINNFQTRSDMNVNTDMFRGQISAHVKVVEYENGKAKIAWEEDKVIAKYPKNAPSDGVSNLGDVRAYIGTVDAFTTVLAQRFYKHEEERRAGE